MYRTIATPAGPRPVPPSAESAQSLILVAFVLQAIVSALAALVAGFGLVALFVGTAVFPPFAPLALVLVPFILLGLLPLFLLWVGYEYSYLRTKNGDYAGARAPTLVLGIIGIPFGFLIIGILYLIAYLKLGDAISELRAPQGFYPGSPGWTYPGGPYPG